MTKNELSKLKTAAKSMQTVNDTFSISGKQFDCRWNGHEFIWTPPSGNSFIATLREVVQWIADGKYINDYCFSYGDVPSDN